MKVRTLVVDDERIPRRMLGEMVASVPWMELIGEADRGAIASQVIEAQEPDLVFIDIKMPDMSGIEVLERAAHRPAVVFTTAYDEFAVRALQLGALDYLIKPFGRTRFLEAAERARERLAQVVRHQGGESVRRDAPIRAHAATRLYVRDRGAIIPVPLDRIERIEAQADYSLLCVDSRKLLVLAGLGDLEGMLDPERFVRIHRSHIVSLDFVASFRPYDARRYVVVLRSGYEIIASGSGTRLLRGLVL